MSDISNESLPEVFEINHPEAALQKTAAALATLKRSLSAVVSLQKLLPGSSSDVGVVDWSKLRAAVDQLSGQFWKDLQAECDSAAILLADTQAAEEAIFQSRFAEIAAARGWVIHGVWPELVVNQVVFFKIDIGSHKLTINDRALRVMTVQSAVNSIDSELRALCSKTLEPQQWLHQLAGVYDLVRSRQAIIDGDAIPVYDLIPEMAFAQQSNKFLRNPTDTNYATYGLAHFRADLTRVLQAGENILKDGRHLRLSAGSFGRDNFLMYFPATRHLGSCGRLAFQSTPECGRSTS